MEKLDGRGRTKGSAFGLTSAVVRCYFYDVHFSLVCCGHSFLLLWHMEKACEKCWTLGEE